MRHAAARQTFERQAVPRPAAIARHAGRTGAGLLPLLALAAACLDSAALYAGGELLKAFFSFR